MGPIGSLYLRVSRNTAEHVPFRYNRSRKGTNHEEFLPFGAWLIIIAAAVVALAWLKKKKKKKRKEKKRKEKKDDENRVLPGSWFATLAQISGNIDILVGHRAALKNNRSLKCLQEPMKGRSGQLWSEHHTRLLWVVGGLIHLWCTVGVCSWHSSMNFTTKASITSISHVHSLLWKNFIPFFDGRFFTHFCCSLLSGTTWHTICSGITMVIP